MRIKRNCVGESARLISGEGLTHAPQAYKWGALPAQARAGFNSSPSFLEAGAKHVCSIVNARTYAQTRERWMVIKSFEKISKLKIDETFLKHFNEIHFISTPFDHPDSNVY